MCGIVAYLGNKTAQPILIEGLKRLEYRGYDSAGIALLENESISISKSAGRISNLEDTISQESSHASLGIGHTRWATHGKPNTINSHPHMDYTGKIAIVHNGIIENYATLKNWLEKKDITFAS
jgi:glucosamine--fructose-6-phosphate aminotransferase (isomerizing)